MQIPYKSVHTVWRRSKCKTECSLNGNTEESKEKTQENRFTVNIYGNNFQVKQDNVKLKQKQSPPRLWDLGVYYIVSLLKRNNQNISEAKKIYIC